MARLLRPEVHRPAEMALWEAVWRQDGNMAAAWRCYRMARAWRLPLPPSVLSELDRIALCFAKEVHDKSDRRLRGRAKGLTRDTVGRIVTGAGRGATDPAEGLLAWERDIAIAAAVGVLRHNGESEAAAVDCVAEGTTDLATRLVFEGDEIRLEWAPTPALSTAAVRRAVRRVAALSTDVRDSTVLNDTTVV